MKKLILPLVLLAIACQKEPEEEILLVDNAIDIETIMEQFRAEPSLESSSSSKAFTGDMKKYGKTYSIGKHTFKIAFEVKNTFKHAKNVLIDHPPFKIHYDGFKLSESSSGDLIFKLQWDDNANHSKTRGWREDNKWGDQNQDEVVKTNLHWGNSGRDRWFRVGLFYKGTDLNMYSNWVRVAFKGYFHFTPHTNSLDFPDNHHILTPIGYTLDYNYKAFSFDHNGLHDIFFQYKSSENGAIKRTSDHHDNSDDGVHHGTLLVDTWGHTTHFFIRARVVGPHNNKTTPWQRINYNHN